MDLLTYALLSKKIASATTGIANAVLTNGTLTITSTDGASYNISLPTTDTTLANAGSPADAKTVGNAIAALGQSLASLEVSDIQGLASALSGKANVSQLDALSAALANKANATTVVAMQSAISNLQQALAQLGATTALDAYPTPSSRNAVRSDGIVAYVDDLLDPIDALIAGESFELADGTIMTAPDQSAYAAAVEGGFSGTRAQFNQLMAEGLGHTGIAIAPSTDDPDIVVLIDDQNGTTIKIPEIDDEHESPNDTWSSQKIAAELAANGGIEIGNSPTNPSTQILIDPSTNQVVEVPQIDDTTTSEVDTWSSAKIASEIAGNAPDWLANENENGHIANKPGSPTTVLGVRESVSTEVYDYTHIVDHINGTISATVAEVTSPTAEKVRVIINGHKYLTDFIKSQSGYTYYGYNHNSSWGLIDDTDIGIEVFFSDDGTDNEVNVSVGENCAIDWVNAIEDTSDVTIGVEMLAMMPGYIPAADWEENDPSKSTYITNKPVDVIYDITGTADLSTLEIINTSISKNLSDEELEQALRSNSIIKFYVNAHVSTVFFGGPIIIDIKMIPIHMFSEVEDEGWVLVSEGISVTEYLNGALPIYLKMLISDVHWGRPADGMYIEQLNASFTPFDQPDWNAEEEEPGYIANKPDIAALSILTDTATNKHYKLIVTNGQLGVEEVE